MNFVGKVDYRYDCGNGFFRSNGYMERVGDTTVTLCGRESIKIFNVKTAKAERHVNFFNPCGEGCALSWQSVIGGHDEKLYVYNSASVETGEPAYGVRNLKRYDPLTEDWSYIVLPEFFDSYGDVVWFRPIDVGKNGNIYVQIRFIEDKVVKTDLVKTDAKGQLIWHLTKADLPDEQIMFLDDDLFVALETGRLLQVMPIPASATPR